jgi:hypothetical protein
MTDLVVRSDFPISSSSSTKTPTVSGEATALLADQIPDLLLEYNEKSDDGQNQPEYRH